MAIAQITQLPTTTTTTTTTWTSTSPMPSSPCCRQCCPPCCLQRRQHLRRRGRRRQHQQDRRHHHREQRLRCGRPQPRQPPLLAPQLPPPAGPFTPATMSQHMLGVEIGGHSHPTLSSDERRILHRTEHRHNIAPNPPQPPPSSTRKRPPLLRLAMSTVCWTMLLLCIATPALADCPRQCECKWKSGKESVQCLKANLTGLPPFLDAGTQILDLTGNEIAAIQADVFTHANLLNLQRLFVAKCRIRTIDRFGFRKIKNLVELDLSYNVLNSVPTHAFDSTPELRDLKLAGNPIQVLETHAFANVPQLVRLELTDCQLRSIEPGAFGGLEQSLEVLKIDRNHLVTVDSPTFTALSNLHGIELAGNPWDCSCALRELRRWMLRDKIPYGIPPVCQLPERLAARSWDKIELDDFACVPQIEAAPAIVQAVEGDNVTIVCGVRSVPEPTVNWYARGRLLANLSGEVQVAVTQGRKVFIARWWPDESNLTIVHADMLDAGVYNCTAANNAGRAESSIVLQMTRRPPEALLSWRVLVTGVLVAAALVVTCAVLALFVCSSARAKGGKLLRWKKSRRTESCENIEMTFNANGKRLDNGAGPKPYGENGISVVGQTQKNRYRSVPSDDEVSLYEESTAGQAAGSQGTTTASTASVAGSSTVGRQHQHQQQQQRDGKQPPDVQVPRLIDFCDQIPTSANASLDGCPFDPNKSEYTSPTKTPILLYTKPNWSQQQQQQQLQQHQKLLTAAVDHANPSNSDSVYSSSSYDRRAAGSHRTTAKQSSHCDTDSTYPDLLDISSLSINSKLRVNTQAIAAALVSREPSPINAAATAINAACATSELPFSTYPRQKPSPGRTKSAALAAAAAAAHFSDSQSLLMASNSSSHLLSNLSINLKQHQKPPPHQPYHHSTAHQRHTVYHQSPPSHTQTQPQPRMLPSLPTKDDNHVGLNTSLLLDYGGGVHNQHLHMQTAAAAAALLNNNPAGSVLDSPGSPVGTTTGAAASSIIATAQAYDYHAAQLERFLEEYRNLQQQLCRMKETCDTIRHKDAPGVQRTGGDRQFGGQTTSTAPTALPDSLMGFPTTTTTMIPSPNMNAPASVASVAAIGGPSAVNSNGSPTNKVSMRKSTSNPRQPPDPPPYWMHRTAIQKRMQTQAAATTTTAASANVAGGHSSNAGTAAAASAANNGNDMQEYFRPQS